MRVQSVANSWASQTLSESNSLQGTWESCGQYTSIIIVINTTSTGKYGRLVVEFSVDKSTITTTCQMLCTDEHFNRPITCPVFNTQFRVRFVAIDLYDTRSPTVANSFSGLSITTQLSQTLDVSDIVMTEQLVQLYGVNTLAADTTRLLGTGTTLNTIATYVRPTSNCTLRVVNASGTNNSESGTGARTFLVTGVDENLNEVLWAGGLVASDADTWSNGNGVSQISPAGFVAVNDIRLLTYGSAGQADSGSTISVQINSNGWTTVAQLSSSNGFRCSSGVYTVPAGHALLPRSIHLSSTSRTDTIVTLNVVPYGARQANNTLRLDTRGLRTRRLQTLKATTIGAITTGSVLMLECTSSSTSNTVAARVTMLRKQAATNASIVPVTATLTVDDLFAAKSYTEDTPLTLSLFTPTTSNSTLTITLTLSDTGAGSLNTGTSGAVTSTFSSGVWSASGAKANVVTLLSALVFTPTANYNSNFTISSVVSDGSMTLTGLNAVTGVAVNDAPTATNRYVPVSYTATTALPTIVVADVDSANVTVTMTVSPVGSGSITTGTSNSTTSTFSINTWSVSGPIADVNTLLAGISYVPNDTSNPSISISVSDGTTSLSGLWTLTYNAPPSATNLSAAQSYTMNTPLSLTAIVITDDSASVTATLTLSDTGAGTINTGTSGAVTSTFSSGVWSATGAVASVNALLAALTFTPTSSYTSSFTIATSVTDGSSTVTGSKAMTAASSYPTSGLVANFDATDPLATGTPPADGTLMSSWVDLVAGLTYTASTTARPTFVTSGSNSKNCLRFNGTSNVLTAQSTSLPWTTAASFFIVCTRATSNDRYLIGADNTDGNSPAIIVNYDNGGRRNFEWYFGRSGITERSILDTSSALTLNICAILRTNGGGAGTLQGYFNGTQAFSTASAADITGKVMRFIGAPSTLYLSSAFDGDICQIMMYNRIVDSTERAQITSYLASRWSSPTATNLSAAQTYALNTSLAVTAIVISYVAGASVTVTLTLSDTGAGTFNTGILDGVSSTFSSGVWSVSGAFETVNTFLATLMFTPTTGYTSSFSIATSVTNGSSAVTGSKAMTLVGMVSGAGIYVNARDVSNNGGTLPSNGSTISTWYDMSGNSRNLIHDSSSGNAGTDPTIVYNTFGASAAVFFAGLKNRLILSSNYTPGTTATYVIYFKIRSGHTSDNMFLMGSLANASGRYQIIRYDGSAATAYIKQYNGNTNGVTSGMWWPITKSSSTAYTVIMRQSGTTGTLRINGVATSNVGNGTTTGLTTMQNESHSFGSMGSIGIGSAASSQTCNAYIGLMAIYASTLSDADCEQIESYITNTFV